MAAPLGGMGAPHRPVLLQETMKFLAPERGGLFVDCTVGLGGHSEQILESSKDAHVIGIDLDMAALEYAKERLARYAERFHLVHANFREIREVLRNADEHDPEGILADLGVSSLQFDSPDRGFSFRFDAPLDMRMDPSSESEAGPAQRRRPQVESDSSCNSDVPGPAYRR